jgi:hypothetical protein
MSETWAALCLRVAQMLVFLYRGHKMKVIGVLCQVLDKTAPDSLAVINPETLYYIVPADRAPDDWITVIDRLRHSGDFAPLGVIIEADEVRV